MGRPRAWWTAVTRIAPSRTKMNLLTVVILDGGICIDDRLKAKVSRLPFLALNGPAAPVG